MERTNIIQRADKRIKEISYQLSRLENEKALLEAIQQGEILEFEAETDKLIAEYRQLYKKQDNEHYKQ